MIPQEFIEEAAAFAREPGTTYAGVRRFIECCMEDAARAVAARRGDVGLDSVAGVSYFMDPECSFAAERIFESLQGPHPMTFFAGKPYHEGLAAYRAHMQSSPEPPKGKGAYVV